MRKLVLICLFLGVACVPIIRAQTPLARDPVPYETSTPIATEARSTAPVEVIESVLPSPTPFTYTVKAGDTLSQVAEKFNVELDALLAINPDINPNGMSVGETLKIPSRQKNTTAESNPPPAAFALREPVCYPTVDRGLWCFALAHNDSLEQIENVTAQVLLLDDNGQQVRQEVALLPLDILPPGESLPISIFFAPDVPPSVHAQIQILTAIRLAPNDPRYLKVAIQNTQVQVDQSGYSAQVSGRVSFPAGSKAASHIWVAAVAYNAAGDVTGVRRWESGGDPVFAFLVSSIGGRIDRVEFSVEARP